MLFPSIELFQVQDVTYTFLDTGSVVEVTCIFTSSSDSKGCRVVFECETVKANENLQYILSLFKNLSSSNSTVGSLPCDSLCPSYIMSIFDIFNDGSTAEVPAVIHENVTCPENLNPIVPEPTHQLCKCVWYNKCVTFSISYQSLTL